MSVEQFNQQYPALATKNALAVAKDSGLPLNDPKTVITAMHSDTYQNRMTSSAERRNDRAMARLARPDVKQVANFDPKNTDVTAGYNQKAAAIQDNRTAQGVYLEALNGENAKLGQLSSFNREAYTAKRLQEMQPTQDIDKAILDLRNRALFSQAAMFDEVKHLPFNLQQTAIAARMKTFTDQIDDLSTLRESRVAAAKDQITEEVGTYEGRISASKTRIEGLNTALNIMKSMGADDVDLAQMRIDHAREMDKLGKTRAGSGGMATGEELITNALIQKYQAEHEGATPSGADLTEIKRQAKLAASTRPDIVKQVAEAGGNYGAMRGTPEQYTENYDLGRSIFDPSSWFRDRNVPITKERMVNPLDKGPYGIPVQSIGGLSKERLELLKLAKDAAKE